MSTGIVATSPPPPTIAAGDNRAVVQFAIRCLPRVPVSTAELQGWLEQEVAGLRDRAPLGTIRLSRLIQELPNLDVGLGWLIEFEVPEDQPLLRGNHLSSVLRDLRLLGLQPTLLIPSTEQPSPASRR